MAITQAPENRDLGNSVGSNRQRVRILRAIPGYPVGAIVMPRPELCDRWIKMGVAEIVKSGKKRKPYTHAPG